MRQQQEKQQTRQMTEIKFNASDFLKHSSTEIDAALMGLSILIAEGEK